MLKAVYNYLFGTHTVTTPVDTTVTPETPVTANNTAAVYERNNFNTQETVNYEMCVEIFRKTKKEELVKKKKIKKKEVKKTKF